MNPVQPNVAKEMNAVANTIADALPDGVGFALLVFDFDPGGFMNYISNARREDMVKAMREFLSKWEMEGG